MIKHLFYRFAALTFLGAALMFSGCDQSVSGDDPEPAISRDLSDNAFLESLSLSEGTLTPEFDPEVTEYTALAGVPSLTITARSADSKARVTGAGEKTLTSGANPLTVTVTAENGETARNYTVIVTRRHVILKTLTPSAGTLTPAFDPAVTEYSILVDNSVSSITISPTLREQNDAAVITNTAGSGQSLHVGINTVAIHAESEGAAEDYTITVARRDANAAIAIKTAGELAKIGAPGGLPLAENYVLDADITLAEWTPLGNGVWKSATNFLANTSKPFTGVFDGAGHTIALQSFSAEALAPNKHYTGIFSAVKGTPGRKAAVKNLHIVSSVTASSAPATSHAVGLVAGYTEQAEIRDITLSGAFSFTSTGTNVYAGGAVGFAYIGTVIQDCSSSMDVTLTGGRGGGFVSTSFYNFTGGFAGIFKDGADITRCTMTGNVTGRGSFSASQMFAGGIAGGSDYGFSTLGNGTISYCSNTGDVFADAGGYWSWTGGITGVVCGGGDGTFENATKVYRCKASGNVTSEGGAGQWPYTGGIAGYVYYGGAVAESCFTGNVTSRGKNGGAVNDYAGGIAGYLSKTERNNSVIRDCWSSGTVNGWVNGGGIVGQMQIYTYLWNCYSTAAVTVSAGQGALGNMSQQGAGGIAGYNASAETGGVKRPGKNALSSCVALNPSISAPNGFEHTARLIGWNSGEQQDNYSWSGMAVTVSGAAPLETLHRFDGAECAEKPAQAFYEGIGWDFAEVWRMAGDGYPRLQWE
ncbi:MAG: cadherin-like beta sandwich domain-containing protein [Spirochaetaceae bacterium]|jgi:hypothetical protein|nr:cadherin-like beta sandwich domain-containing protein [Spirochaetaceae bacterium]